MEPQLLLLLLAVKTLDLQQLSSGVQERTLWQLCFDFHCVVEPDCQESLTKLNTNTKHMVGVEQIHSHSHTCR